MTDYTGQPKRVAQDILDAAKTGLVDREIGAASDTEKLYIPINGTLYELVKVGDSVYAPASEGVTNGNSHDHSGGDGAQIDHTSLSSVGTNSHAQIDTHIGTTAGNPHNVTAADVGVEAGADVTDATNVNAAGATMNTDTDVSGNSWVLDEDDLQSNSATKVPTQQSVKAYADAIAIAGGSVDTSGSPVANDYARFTDANTIEGRSYAEVRADLNVEDGADVTDATNVAAAGAAMDGGAHHDGFSDFVANEHIDWTVDQGAINIHTDNLPDLSGIVTFANLDANLDVGSGSTQVAAGDHDHDSDYAKDPHGNEAHAGTYIEAGDVTFETLNSNSDIGPASNQLAAGDHDHDSDYSAATHGNAAHTGTYIEATDVTFENLNTNGDVGSGDTQLAAGNHDHDSDYAAATHGNAAHTGTYIEAADVTFGNLNANLDVGSGSAQVAAGDHTHTGFALASHGNEAHSSTFITATGVTSNNLGANSGIGNGSDQVSAGDHTHDGASGLQIDHDDLSSIGTNTHAQIDTHINTTTGNPHNVTAADIGVEPGADVTDSANVNAAGAVMETDYDENTILYATTNNTPTALTIAASTIVGRGAAGGIDALTAAEVRTLINVEDGADVTDATNVAAAGALMHSDVDDTPVDGATTVPASSNWAFDHVADADAHHNESHTVASHSDTTATGAELNTLTDGGDADYLHGHGSLLSAAEIDDTPVDGETNQPISSNWAYDHANNGDAHHDESHTISSHDTTATGTQLNTLTNGSVADALHSHESDAPKHYIDDADRHYGVSGTEDNFLSRNSDGLPQDSGYAASDFADTNHDNSSHSETFITALGVTYEALNANGDVGSAAGTLCAGDDPRLSDDRDPTSHAAEHTNGTDDIQDATTSQKGLMTAAQATKLDGIEASATADQTGGEIKTAYEAQANTNAYTDAEKSKLAGIESNATADQSNSEIEAAYNAQVSQVSSGEKTAGTETAVRRFSPDDIKDMVDEHAPSGVPASNCCIEVGEYTGDGGTNKQVSLTASWDPIFVVVREKSTAIGSSTAGMYMVSGATYASFLTATARDRLRLGTACFYADDDGGNNDPNASGVDYVYMALGIATS